MDGAAAQTGSDQGLMDGAAPQTEVDEVEGERPQMVVLLHQTWRTWTRSTWSETSRARETDVCSSTAPGGACRKRASSGSADSETLDPVVAPDSVLRIFIRPKTGYAARSGYNARPLDGRLADRRDVANESAVPTFPVRVVCGDSPRARWGCGGGSLRPWTRRTGRSQDRTAAASSRPSRAPQTLTRNPLERNPVPA